MPNTVSNIKITSAMRLARQCAFLRCAASLGGFLPKAIGHIKITIQIATNNRVLAKTSFIRVNSMEIKSYFLGGIALTR